MTLQAARHLGTDRMGKFTADAGVALMQVLRGRDQATAWGGFALLSSTTYRCQLLSEQLGSTT
jgi:hypothetical protein